ncbi:hypothetical protein Sjap_012094 [Stephania japonica]|uniref:Uncharacterized protein n=1 Tax=Stephania japonica TaxID=461633 RepID=A0AAP0IXA8_9MAGN
MARNLWQALFNRADRNVKDLGLSVDLMKKESKKLLERAALAEKEMKHGHRNSYLMDGLQRDTWQRGIKTSCRCKFDDVTDFDYILEWLRHRGIGSIIEFCSWHDFSILRSIMDSSTAGICCHVMVPSEGLECGENFITAGDPSDKMATTGKYAGPSPLRLDALKRNIQVK